MTDWDKALWVVIYPINGDNSNVTSEYIDILDVETFEPITLFFAEEAKGWDFSIDENALKSG